MKHLRGDIGWDYVSSIYVNNANALGLPKPLWQHESNMEWFTAGAVKFLEQQPRDGPPFFIYFAPNIPHGGGGERFAAADPRATPEGLVDWHLGVQPSRADVLRRVRAAGIPPNFAWATWLDDGIGVILRKLEERGLVENTLVIFASDQQSRGKWTCYQGSRVPLTVRWPGRVAPGSLDATLLSSVDFAPTLLELAGGQLPVPAEAIIDGRSFASLLTGGAEVVERPVFVEMGYGRAILRGNWKYIAVRHPSPVLARAKSTGQIPDLMGRFRVTNNGDRQRWPSYGAPDQLFELASDPLEQRNLAADPRLRCAPRRNAEAADHRGRAPAARVRGVQAGAVNERSDIARSIGRRQKCLQSLLVDQWCPPPWATSADSTGSTCRVREQFSPTWAKNEELGPQPWTNGPDDRGWVLPAARRQIQRCIRLPLGAPGGSPCSTPLKEPRPNY